MPKSLKKKGTLGKLLANVLDQKRTFFIFTSSIFCLLFSVLCYLSSVSPAWSAPSKYLNYQGKLSDSTGKAVSGTHKLTFRIYDASSGGTKVWEESQNVAVSSGIFSAILGKSTAFDLTFNKDYWLTLDVDDTGEMSPRQQLVANPHSMNATYLDGVSSSSFLRSDEDDTIEKDLTLKGTLTFSGVSTDITTGSNEDLTINPSGSGSVVLNIDSATTGFKVTDGTTDWLIVDDAGNATFTSDTGTDLFNIKVGNLKVGDGTVSQTLSGESAYIEGALEVDGKIYADGGISGTLSTNDGIFLPDDKDLALGNTSSSPDVALQWDTAQTQDALLLGLSGSNSLILLEQADMSGDYAHSTQTNPTLFIHSATGASSATTQWVSLAHDATNAVIATGLGDIVLDPIGNDVLPSANNTDNLGSSSLRWGTVYVGTLDATTIASGSTITHSLDAAYDDGSTITVDTGAITLNDSITSTTNALAITNTGVVSGSTSRDVMNITSSSTHTTTGTVALLGMDFTGTVSSGTAEGVNIQMGASTQNAVNTNAVVRAATLTSTASTGTAPLTVSSTTVVTNLNADTVDAISSGSFLRSDAADTFDSGITLTVAGTLSVTGQADIGDNSSTVAINSSDWDISTVGAMTRIDSIANTSADLALSTTTSGNITATPAAATGLFNVVTGNLRVGTGGTPGVTLDGEDAYIEGTLEVDGNVQIDGTLTAAAITATSTGTNYTWTLASGADFVIDDMTSAQTLTLQNSQSTADTAVFYVKDTATANQADLVIAPSDGGVLIDTPGATELSSVTTTDAREALAITTDPSKVGGGAGSDADGVIKMGVQEGAWEYIWYDASQGSQGKFEFSAPHNVASSSPAGISFFDANDRTKTQDFSWDPSDQSFEMSGGLFKHDFRNLVKNASFEAFSILEQFHDHDPALMTTATGSTTSSGGVVGDKYRGGWDSFAPDDWVWVKGDVFQHAPEVFAGTAATSSSYQSDFLQGKSSVTIKDAVVGTASGTDAAGNTLPGDGNDGAIKQVITGLKPNTFYAIGVSMLVTNSGNTTALVDITGEYGEDSGEPASSRFTALTTSGSATPTVFTQYKGTFKTDATATDIVMYLLCRQTGSPVLADAARFDTVQVVAGRVVPEFEPNPITDTGDQTLYGSLRLGRTSNERGGILSVDQFVRTRGIELFTDDPGFSGEAGGMASIMSPSPIYNTGGGAVGTQTLTTSGVYAAVDPAEYRITITAQGDAGLGTNDKFNWERRYINYAVGGSSNTFTELGTNINVSTSDITLENGVKIKFGAVRGGNVNDRWIFSAVGMDLAKQYSSFDPDSTYVHGATRIFKDADANSPTFGKMVFQDGSKKVTLDQITTAGVQNPSRIDHPYYISAGGTLSMSTLGNFNGTVERSFEVEVAANGATSTDSDLYKWRLAGGTWSSNTVIKAAGDWPANVTKTLQEGVQIRFAGSVSGNYSEGVIADRWTFKAYPQTGGSIDADKVDSFHASSAASPTAGYLVATDPTTGKFPGSVIPGSVGISDTTENSFKIGSSADAAATDLTLQYGNTNPESIKFTGTGVDATADRFEISDTINIPTGEKYMINGAALAFSDLGGSVGDTQIATGAVDLDTSEVAGVLAAANGGTGNAFFSVSGPATSVKTYTFPNANSTVAALGQAQTFTALQTFNPSITATADTNASITDISGTLVEAASGTHARLVGLNITAPSVTAGVGAVTDAASVYISAAPAASGATNYAMWIDAGLSRFDGNIRMDGSTSGAITFAVPATVTSHTLTWPSAVGGASTFLQTDASGNLSWVAQSSDSPANAEYVTYAATTALSAERVLTLSGNDTMGANLSMGNSYLLLNIGDAGTDFTSGGGLSLAGTAVLSANPSISPAANANGSITDISGTLVEAGSGTHARLVGLNVIAPTITGGVAGVSDASSLYISGAPSASGASNYSLWVDSGNARFDGYVGIGDATPDGILDVESTGAVSALSQGINVIHLTTNTTTDGINKQGVYITSTGDFTGSTGAVTRNYGLYIDTVSGADENYGLYVGDNVGLGGVGATTELLVRRTAAQDVDFIIDPAASQKAALWFYSADLARWAIYKNSTAEGGSDAGSDLAIASYNDAGSLLRDNILFIKRSNGYVGFGDATPDYFVDIEDAASPTLAIEDTTTPVRMELRSTDTASTVAVTTNHPLVLQTNNTVRMYIDESGNTGIAAGMAAPDPTASLEMRNNTASSAMNTVEAMYQLNSGGAGAANIGSRIAFGGETATDGTVDVAAAVGGLLTTATAGAVDGALVFYTRSGGGSFTEQMRINSTGNLVMSSTLIQDIGNTGTDFTSGGGLSLAGTAVLSANPTISPSASANGSITDVSGTLVEAGSGTHARLVGLNITPPTITQNFGSGTDYTASLYISAAPTLSDSLSNYALWVDSGTAQFDNAVNTGPLTVSFATGGTLSTAVSVTGTGSEPGDTTTNYGLYLRNLTTNTSLDGHTKYGVYIESTGTWTGGAGTANDNYGLYVVTPTGADNNYGIYVGGGGTNALFVDSGTSRFDGNILMTGSTSGTITFAVPATVTSHTLTWPSAQGGDEYYLKNDGAGGLSWSSPATVVRKATTESLASSTTLQNDDELLIAIGASETWQIEGFLDMFNASATPDIKIAFTVPTGATMNIAYHAGGGTTTSFILDLLTGSGTAGAAIPLGASVVNPLFFKGIVVNSTTAGNIQLQWAQSTSNANATQVRANSYIKGTRL